VSQTGQKNSLGLSRSIIPRPAAISCFLFSWIFVCRLPGPDPLLLYALHLIRHELHVSTPSIASAFHKSHRGARSLPRPMDLGRFCSISCGWLRVSRLDSSPPGLIWWCVCWTGRASVSCARRRRHGGGSRSGMGRRRPWNPVSHHR
jgi:hypothetical protein